MHVIHMINILGFFFHKSILVFPTRSPWLFVLGGPPLTHLLWGHVCCLRRSGVGLAGVVWPPLEGHSQNSVLDWGSYFPGWVRLKYWKEPNDPFFLSLEKLIFFFVETMIPIFFDFSRYAGEGHVPGRVFQHQWNWNLHHWSDICSRDRQLRKENPCQVQYFCWQFVVKLDGPMVMLFDQLFAVYFLQDAGNHCEPWFWNCQAPSGTHHASCPCHWRPLLLHRHHWSNSQSLEAQEWHFQPDDDGQYPTGCDWQVRIWSDWNCVEEITYRSICSSICWWVFSALVETTRTLRLRRNLVKLSLYRHFANTLVFSVVASVTFMLWSIKYHRMADCLVGENSQ